MKKYITRLAFALWIVGAPFVLLGCGEEGGAPSSPAPPPGDAAKVPPPADAAKK